MESLAANGFGFAAESGHGGDGIMNNAAKVAGMVVGITGLFQIVLGLVFWTGHARFLLQLHTAVGVVFVLALWTVAAIALRARAPLGLIVLAFAWGAVVLLFGMTQAQILPGPNHWIIRALHLLVGMGAMGQASGLVRRIHAGAESRPVVA
jgi:hypothetical protein